VFACFTEFKKAFDSVNYRKLFAKLLGDGVNCLIVQFGTAIKCDTLDGNCLSAGFHHEQWHDTRQGGVLFPYLFTRYIREMLMAIVNSRIGRVIGDQFVNILAYADDIAVSAPTWKALQSLLNILNGHVAQLNMQCIVEKTVCMVFNPVNQHCIVAEYGPLLSVGNKFIKYVSTFKYF